MIATSTSPRRVVIVDGVRTPFARRSGELAELSAIDLGRHVVSEVLDRNDVDPESVDQVVFGQVILDPSTPNIAREVVLGTGLPPTVEAYSVSKACITSYQTTVNVAQAIAAGVIDCGGAGGPESASHVPVLVSPALQDALLAAADADPLAPAVLADEQAAALGMAILLRAMAPAQLPPWPPATSGPVSLFLPLSIV